MITNLWQATISFGRPGQSKTDDELTEHLVEKYHTGKKALRAVKQLWGDSLRPHVSFEGKVRRFHKDMTFEGIGSIRVSTEGERQIMKNEQRKSDQADAMFESLVSEMKNAQGIKRVKDATIPTGVPSWL